MGKRRRQAATGLTEDERIAEAIERKRVEDQRRADLLTETMARSVASLMGLPKVAMKRRGQWQLPPTSETGLRDPHLTQIEAKLLKAKREREE